MAGAVTSLLVTGVAAVPAYAEDARALQWHLDAMHAEDMWKTSKGSGMTVAVIDSGVDDSVPDLKGQVLPGKDFVKGRNDPHDDYGNHGTSMAALIAGTGRAGSAKGTFGLAPESKILPIRVPTVGENQSGDTPKVKPGVNFGPAIRYAADSDAQVINLSLGRPGAVGKDDDEAAAIRYALAKGKLVVAATGNAAKKGNPTEYPAGFPGVIGVGAIGKDGSQTDESTYGPQTDLAAPGDEMVQACTGGTELCRTHGTSDATALTSASAALIWSKHPNWTANQVTRVLVNTAGGPKSGDKRNDFIGHGAVRPRVALKDPGDPGDPKTNPLPGPYYEGNKESSKAEKKPLENSNSQQQKASSEEDGSSFGQVAGYVFGAVVVLAASIGTPLFMHRLRRRRDRRTYL